MNTKTCLSLLAAFAAPALVAGTPVIKAGSVTFSQNSATRLVTVGYTQEETDAVVTVDVLTNGVSIGAENFTNIDGDVNRRRSGIRTPSSSTSRRGRLTWCKRMRRRRICSTTWRMA